MFIAFVKLLHARHWFMYKMSPITRVQNILFHEYETIYV